MKQAWRDFIASQQVVTRDAGLWRTRQTLTSAQGVEVQLGSKSLVNFSSNDYLGLANHPALKRYAEAACREYGVGSGASHLVCGHLESHQQLEEELASFVGAGKALLFSSGYMANLAVISSFLGKNDLLLQDKRNHASIIDGARLSSARLKRYAHGNLAHAEALINAASFERCMIASDSVFSMDGNLAPLAELVALAARSKALLFIDDAHGFGVLGENGQGALEATGLKPQGRTLMMGTLSKALGCYGAFVAGDELYIEHLIQNARPYIYTTSLPPAVSASALAALDLIRNGGGELRAQLRSNIEHFKQGAAHLGLPVQLSETAIQPILIGKSSDATRVSTALLEAGFNVVAIRPPTVSKGTARIRIALSSAHTYEHIDQLLNALAWHMKGTIDD